MVRYGTAPRELTLNSTGVTANSESQMYSIQLSELRTDVEYFYVVESRNVFDRLSLEEASFVTIVESELHSRGRGRGIKVGRRMREGRMGAR